MSYKITDIAKKVILIVAFLGIIKVELDGTGARVEHFDVFLSLFLWFNFDRYILIL